MIKKFVLFGALTGFSVSLLLLLLIFVRPFPVSINGYVEHAARYLCPTLLLFFSSSFHSIGSAVSVIVLSNALLYAIVFGIVGMIASATRNRRNAV